MTSLKIVPQTRCLEFNDDLFLFDVDRNSFVTTEDLAKKTNSYYLLQFENWLLHELIQSQAKSKSEYMHPFLMNTSHNFG